MKFPRNSRVTIYFGSRFPLRSRDKETNLVIQLKDAEGSEICSIGSFPTTLMCDFKSERY